MYAPVHFQFRFESKVCIIFRGYLNMLTNGKIQYNIRV